MACIFACSPQKKEDTSTSTNVEKKNPTPNGEVMVTTNLMDIVMPDTLMSGLNRIRYENKSDMIHFLLFNKVPDSINRERYAKELTRPFQEVMDAIAKGEEPPNNFPEWLAGMVNFGGVGLTSAKTTSTSYVDLDPGTYIVECYIKSNGVFHSSTGMLKEVLVLDKKSDLSRPKAAVQLQVSGAGISSEESMNFVQGENTIEVQFVETKLYPNFTRPDVHLLRLDEQSDLQKIENFVDWMLPDGMIMAAPAEFLGGVQEMPDGKVASFTVNLIPGRYALIGEVPKAMSSNFFIEFSVE